MPTACQECRHLRRVEGSGPRAGIWYNLLCTATPLPLVFEPLTGKMTEQNPPWAYVRDVNKGECPKFEDRAAMLPSEPGKRWGS